MYAATGTGPVVVLLARMVRTSSCAPHRPLRAVPSRTSESGTSTAQTASVRAAGSKSAVNPAWWEYLLGPVGRRRGGARRGSGETAGLVLGDLGERDPDLLGQRGRAQAGTAGQSAAQIDRGAPPQLGGQRVPQDRSAVIPARTAQQGPRSPIRRVQAANLGTPEPPSHAGAARRRFRVLGRFTLRHAPSGHPQPEIQPHRDVLR